MCSIRQEDVLGEEATGRRRTTMGEKMGGRFSNLGDRVVAEAPETAGEHR